MDNICHTVRLYYKIIVYHYYEIYSFFLLNALFPEEICFLTLVEAVVLIIFFSFFFLFVFLLY